MREDKCESNYICHVIMFLICITANTPPQEYEKKREVHYKVEESEMRPRALYLLKGRERRGFVNILAGMSKVAIQLTKKEPSLMWE